MSLKPRTVRPTATAAALAVALAALLASPLGATTTLSVQRVATGLVRPVAVVSPPGDSRLFIVEQRGADARGRIKIFKDGALLPTPFLTTAPLATGNEQGLLGLAFPPDFATSGVFYINYTSAGGAGTTRLARHRVSVGNPDRADSLGEVFFSLTQPYTNHNGGWLGFGPDGYLYVAVGDGGDAGDPGDRAQNLNSHFGKLLRLDVSGPTGYTSPADNPFVGVAGRLPEIWSFGLRNPFRCSFDRATGDLVIGDVGQLLWEEVDFAAAPGRGRGVNYGWKCWEGNHPYGTSTTTPCASCAQSACFVFPAHEYEHSLGRCSVTGGFVYRGCAIPDLQGTYFFGDYCGGQVYAGKFVGGSLTGVTDRNAELVSGPGYVIDQISSFGEDAFGELYICDLGGQVYKIVPRTGVAEADMPALSVLTSSGAVLGASGPGNAHLPGITPFTDAGSRIAGAGYLGSAQPRGCVTSGGGCLTTPLRLGTWDLDVTSCVDADSVMLTRTFVVTNRAATPQDLDFRDVIAPWLDGDDDTAATFEPATAERSGLIVQFDSDAPTSYVRHRGFATGATITQDVDTRTAVEGRVAADQALAGGLEAGPARLALALGFDFGAIAPAARETVTVVTRITPTAPLGFDPPEALPFDGRLLRVAGAMPFHGALAFTLTLPVDGAVRLDVFDGRGRLVRTLHDGPMTAGRRTLAWDGRDARGADAPAGLYFVRAVTPVGVESLRAVRVR
jgi:glucose/arabinose dehydrogenase